MHLHLLLPALLSCFPAAHILLDYVGSSVLAASAHLVDDSYPLAAPPVSLNHTNGLDLLFHSLHTPQADFSSSPPRLDESGSILMSYSLKEMSYK